MISINLIKALNLAISLGITTEGHVIKGFSRRKSWKGDGVVFDGTFFLPPPCLKIKFTVCPNYP